MAPKNAQRQCIWARSTQIHGIYCLLHWKEAKQQCILDENSQQKLADRGGRVCWKSSVYRGGFPMKFSAPRGGGRGVEVTPLADRFLDYFFLFLPLGDRDLDLSLDCHSEPTIFSFRWFSVLTSEESYYSVVCSFPHDDNSFFLCCKLKDSSNFAIYY